MKGPGDFNPPLLPGEDSEGSDASGWSFAARNIHLGVREHTMGDIFNGLTAQSDFIGYGSTFPIFRQAPIRRAMPPIRAVNPLGA